VRGSDRKLRALYETANVGIVLTDMNTRYVDFNETFRRFTGYSADELRAHEYRTLTSESDRAGTDEQLEVAKRQGRFGPYEKEYIRKDGSRIPLRFNGALFTDVDGQNYLWSIVDDITERRRLEGLLMNSISAEQHKLGRDLHDGLGQELAGISLLATAIASSTKKSGRAEAGELENLAKIATRALANCRAIAHGLSPVTYADGGIVEVLEEMVRLNRDSFGIEGSCEVMRAAPIRLGADALDNLYRISQEAVANARRHGRARSIKVTLHIQPTLVRLDILDDGVGMPKAATDSGGMGLKIMKFRASTIGARLVIGPGPHGGTLVSVVCPQLPG
jgi:PAS domain S-box-containing protein